MQPFALTNYAPTVRQAILVALQASKRHRRCLLCSKPGVKPGVWLPIALRSPVPDPAVRPIPYTLCHKHQHAADATIAEVMTTRR